MYKCIEELGKILAVDNYLIAWKGTALSSVMCYKIKPTYRVVETVFKIGDGEKNLFNISVHNMSSVSICTGFKYNTYWLKIY